VRLPWIPAAASRSGANHIENTDYGAKLALADVLTGPNGRALRVVTIWMTEEATGQTKFITLYPDKT
jgi:hypothetical protein